MRRGTTPTLEIKLEGVDIDMLDDIYITIKQGETVIEKTNDDIIPNVDTNTLNILLTQEETLSFVDSGTATVQMRATTDYGDAIATNKAILNVSDVLKEGVI